MTITHQLAEFVTRWPVHSIPKLALDRARMCLASTMASAAMGHEVASARIIRAGEIEKRGAPQATVWFDGRRIPAASAARANAVASDAAASDDSDLRSIAHIGTIVATTSVAIGECHARSYGDVLNAMVLGYEVAGRVDEALTPGRLVSGFHGSVSTIFGGAVAAGLLLRLNTAQMTHAIGLAATSIGGIAVAADTSSAREYHAGLSALLGVEAAVAALRGFQAEPAILEAPRGFFECLRAQAIDEVTRDLGHSWDIVTDMAIKLMPGAHPFHALAQAACDAARQADAALADIVRVEVSTAGMHDWLDPQLAPDDFIAAAHSASYYVAAGIADREFGWHHVSDEKLRDPSIRALQQKVTFSSSRNELPDRFAYRHGGTVAIVLKDGRRAASTCRSPRGSHLGGLSWSDVEAKYLRLLPLCGMPGDAIRQSFSAIRESTGNTPVSRITELLRSYAAHARTGETA